MPLHSLLNELICCPACKGDSQLVLDAEEKSLTCNQCGNIYSVKSVPGPDNKGLLLPNLLIDDAKQNPGNK